jgi:hypothetical protein
MRWLSLNFILQGFQQRRCEAADESVGASKTVLPSMRSGKNCRKRKLQFRTMPELTKYAVRWAATQDLV